jgi:parallel beta-helix repeat protein
MEMKKTIFTVLALMLCLLISTWAFVTLSLVKSDTHVDDLRFCESAGSDHVTGDSAVVYVDPETTHALIGSTFTTDIIVANVSDLFSYQFSLYYDTALLDAVEVELPSDHFLKPVKPSNIWIAALETEDDFNSTHGNVRVGVTLLNPEPGKHGQGVLATITFHVNKSGTCVLHLDEADTILVDSSSNMMESKAVDGHFECSATEHDVIVFLEVPSHLVPRESVNIGVHVQNVGLNDETEIVLHLLINETTVRTAQVASMQIGSSYSLSYRWTPRDEAKYNVTGYALPLMGEENAFNNVASKNVAVSYVIRVPVDFMTIKEAVQAASPGDTIRVASGTYFEHVTIDKPVTLVGENVNDTIVDGDGTWRVIQVLGPETYGQTVASKISGFTIQNGLIGIYIKSEGNIIEGNIVKNCVGGIFVFQGGGNVIRRNTVEDNELGIVCEGSENEFYHNNLIDNTDQAVDSGSNDWNSEDEGNYWSDYNGTDVNEDEKGDVPYTVNVTRGTWDYFPLLAEYTSIAGDLNDDGRVNMADLGVAAASFGTYPRHTRWNPTADANHDGKVDMIDLVIVAKNFGKTR